MYPTDIVHVIKTRHFVMYLETQTVLENVEHW